MSASQHGVIASKIHTPREGKIAFTSAREAPSGHHGKEGDLTQTSNPEHAVQVRPHPRPNTSRLGTGSKTSSNCNRILVRTPWHKISHQG